MNNKKIFAIATVVAVLGSCTGCTHSAGVNMSTVDDTDGENTVLTFEALMYDNSGNNYITFKGNSFDITPNKVKQWGYSTDGSWTNWYETSSVVSIAIDDNYVQTCGSTVIFKDSRLEITPLDEEFGTLDNSGESGYSVEIPAKSFENYFALTTWWYDMKENGQGGAKAVLIQSQDGYNIGVVSGNDVTWKVAEGLPKTTLITVDEMPLYIHRCNFTIIDTALLNVESE